MKTYEYLDDADDMQVIGQTFEQMNFDSSKFIFK